MSMVPITRPPAQQQLMHVPCSKVMKRYPNTQDIQEYIQTKRQLLYNNCLFPYCPQDWSFIPKWPYISALKNRNKRNLPLLFHLISEAFCSVSQSRVPTLRHKGGEVI